MNTTQDSGLIAAKTRLTNIKADIAQLKLKALTGEYVSRKTVDEEWQEQVSRVKNKLLGIPTRLAGVISGQELTPSEIQKIIHEAVLEALYDLAAGFKGKPDDASKIDDE